MFRFNIYAFIVQFKNDNNIVGYFYTVVFCHWLMLYVYNLHRHIALLGLFSHSISGSLFSSDCACFYWDNN